MLKLLGRRRPELATWIVDAASRCGRCPVATTVLARARQGRAGSDHIGLSPAFPLSPPSLAKLSHHPQRRWVGEEMLQRNERLVWGSWMEEK